MKIVRLGVVVFFSAFAIASAATPAWCADGGEGGNRPQDPRTSRRGRIQDLGEIEVSMLWDNRARVQMKGSDFEFRKIISDGGETEFVISGGGEPDVTIGLGRSGVTVARGSEIVTIQGAGSQAANDQARGLLTGRALAAFRERAGTYERRLLREEAAQHQPLWKAERQDEPYGYSVLLSAGLLSELTGDPSAFDRLHELIVRRILSRTQVIRVGFQTRDCVTEYELYLVQIDGQLRQCLEAADGRDTWYGRAADRLGCHAEFIARAESGLLQFTSCSTVRLIA